MISQEPHETYIRRVLNSTVEPLVMALIAQKPTDVLLFIHTWLTQRHPSTKMSETEHDELNRLKKSYKSLKAKAKT